MCSEAKLIILSVRIVRTVELSYAQTRIIALLAGVRARKTTRVMDGSLRLTRCFSTSKLQASARPQTFVIYRPTWVFFGVRSPRDRSQIPDVYYVTRGAVCYVMRGGEREFTRPRIYFRACAPRRSDEIKFLDIVFSREGDSRYSLRFEFHGAEYRDVAVNDGGGEVGGRRILFAR